MAFSTLSLHPSLLRAIQELGFERPTDIQRDAIPPALEGRDVLGCAQTGSGKTAAFLLPILQKLIDKPRGTTRAIVLVPTRELAAQVMEDLTDLSRHTPVRGAAVFGGVSAGPQEQAFRRGVDIIVATPGRLLEHLRAPYAKTGQVEFLVLDEADRMLDMGFLPDIKKILAMLPTARQTLFFSATMPPEIRRLTTDLLKRPVTIERERRAATPTAITQAVYPVSQDLKASLLIALIQRGVLKQAIVFTRTKHRANRLADALQRAGIEAAKIHGNRTQGQRTVALDDFKSGRRPILVATDIVARGIDVEDLQHVVNFDVPLVPEDYIHRIGRTGRAEAVGEAFTLAAPDERASLTAIERALGRPVPRATLPDFDYNARVTEKLEVPLAERIAAIRKRKAEERARADARRSRGDGASVHAGARQDRPAGGSPSRGQGRPHRGSNHPPAPGGSRGPGQQTFGRRHARPAAGQGPRRLRDR